MRIIGVFDIYFLILMLIQGGISIFIDAKKFKKLNLLNVSKKAKWFGIVAIVLSVALFITRRII